MPPNARRSLTRRAFALLSVLGLALPAIVSSNHVALRVDGARTSFRTYAATVGDVLANQGVELAAGDQVVPAPYTPVEDGTRIRILRTIEVGLVIDAQPERRVRGTFRSVAGLLEAVGITDLADVVVTPGRRAPVTDGDTVRILTPYRVSVDVDGQTIVRDTLHRDLGLLLAEIGVAVGPADIVEPGLDAPLTDGLRLTIQRVATEEETDEVTLPFDIREVKTDDLLVGTSRVDVEGAEGLRIDTYAITLTDGVETARELVSEEVVREPIDRVIEIGTKPKPKPKPKPAASSNGSVWYDLARCESGGNWAYNGASGYDGGLQFHPSTWTRYKLSGYPAYAYEATAAQQIAVGKRVQAAQGWQAWPSCAKKLGLY